MNTDQNEDKEPIHIEISSEHIEYLTAYWELRDDSDVFAWAISLLRDLTKADEAGWRLTLTKAALDDTTREPFPDKTYHEGVFPLRWFAPSKGQIPRLPIEDIDQILKKKGTYE